ncbi:YARHG domain-containing protein [Abditibacterium utsteinense]|uniref:YARHG domain-containing protein n=1 Tax=Abditibacterium utsteinense TaxID=1960156 RepID=A0A2S8SWD8_9BACT|nr:YARHG domain-containing protein [Abditibacterium utsteinense]PQV65097.1 YARHG domain-containing protein [Abditibacterium utsteinense]
MKISKTVLLLSILAFGAPKAFAAPGEKYPQTRTRVLSASEVANLSPAQRRYAINEIYARHGLLFGDLALRKQFLQFSWYAPQPGRSMAQIKGRFSPVERKNVERLGLARAISNATVKSDESDEERTDFYLSPYAGSSRAWKGERFPETRLSRISSVDIGMMTAAQRRTAANEIYARHGYLFNSMALRKQFLQFSWYKPRPGRSMTRIASSFSAVERANLAALNAAN